jgi:hypothetical protein
MRRARPYDEPESHKAQAARTEEERMYPYLLQSMTAEHVNDLRKEAAMAARVRHARSARAGTRSGVAASRAGTGLARRAVHP